MSNRHVRELLEVVHCIFQDAVYNFPTLAGEFIKDEIRLRRLVESRGINALCVDLVRVGKHLDRCLADGEYKLSGLPGTARYSERVVIPKFLRGLYLLVFDEMGRLKEDCDAEAVLFLRQILFVARKVQLPCPDSAISNEVRDFRIVDMALPEPEGFWSDASPQCCDVERTFPTFRASDLYQSRIAAMDTSSTMKRDLSTLLINLDKISRLITTTLGPYQPNEWRFKHGPGAISERTGPTNKFCWSNWSDRLENVYPIADYGFHNLSSWAANCEKMEIGSIEPSSRLIAVPKTVTKPRLIAAEPSEHQWCQQNLWHYFSERSEKTWISSFVRFRDQTRNQELCVQGSEDGSLATVDLSAASDRVTCSIVGRFFRVNPPLVLALQSSRTRFMKQAINSDVDGEFPLRKFSTMGSACTFPVQSLLFLAVALSAVATKRGIRVKTSNIRKLKGEVAVFGDDIVIPVDSRELLFAALEVLHFKVNSDKSFWTGRFRESCGVDAFRGVNVTPAYWRAPNNGKPESTASTIEVHNNFYSKFLLCTASYIATTMRGDSVPRVRMGSGVLGLKSFQRPIRPVLTRWNKGLQKAEALVTTLTAKIPKTPIQDDSALFQYFTEAPNPTIIWKGGVAQRPLIRKKKRWVPLEDLDSESST
jgi:hypothetical protein